MIFMLLVMSACTANTTNPSNTAQLVGVEILLNEEISPNQATELKVQITQGQENVEDADDVQFEIWRVSGKDPSEMSKAQHEKDGVYSIKKTFQDNGVYYVQAHVTARDIHVMPKTVVIVGDVSEEELNSIKEVPQNKEKNHEHGHDH